MIQGHSNVFCCSNLPLTRQELYMVKSADNYPLTNTLQTRDGWVTGTDPQWLWGQFWQMYDHGSQKIKDSWLSIVDINQITNHKTTSSFLVLSKNTNGSVRSCNTQDQHSLILFFSKNLKAWFFINSNNHILVQTNVGCLLSLDTGIDELPVDYCFFLQPVNNLTASNIEN
jgi:hypothetical protein